MQVQVQALSALLPCVFALCCGAVLENRRAGDSCPDGTRCMPFSMCPSAELATNADSGRQGSCTSSGQELSVCCAEFSALGTLSFLDVRRRRASNHRAKASSFASASRPTLTLKELDVPSDTTRSERACQEHIRQEKRAPSRVARRRNGKKKRALAVVGGEKATSAEFAYMVALGYARTNENISTSDILWGCGGSLISERYVLTAAHCITDALSQNARLVVMRTGVNRLEQGKRKASDYGVESIVLHPQHRADLKYFDLALVRTDRPVAFSATQTPVCLATSATRVDGNATLLVAGWGATDPAGFEMSADLKKAELRLVQKDECKTLIKQGKSLPRGLDENMICAAEPNRKADTCEGDSGGPLVTRERGLDTLVGVTSFGGKPCAGRRPGVYAAVAPHLKWIEDVVWPKT